MKALSQNNRFKGIAFTVFAGMIFGFFPVFTSLFVRFGGELDAFNLYGFVLTVILCAVWMLVGKIPFAVPKKSVFFLVLAGFFNVVTRIFLTNSYFYIDVGVATTLHFMYPLFAALLGRILFRDRMPLYKWAIFLIASASVSLFANGGFAGGQFKGIVLALISSVMFASYMLTTEKAHLAELHPVAFVFYLSIVSAIGSLVMSLISGTVASAMNGKAVLILILCVIANNAIAFIANAQGIRYLGAAMAAVFSLFEPIFSCIFGGIFLQQEIRGRAIIGIVLILLSLVTMVLLDNRAAKKEERQ